MVIMMGSKYAIVLLEGYIYVTSTYGKEGISVLEWVIEKYYSYFPTETYVVGTLRNRLVETFF